MDESRSVLVLDDGELDDIPKLLRRLEIPFDHVRGEAIPAQLDPPGDLLISTVRRAAVVPFSESAPGADADGPVRIGIVEGAERHDRAQLRRCGFDYLVRRPVHPDAMRLLVQHSLYKDTERRSDPRNAVGGEISYKTALLPRRARLLDLTSRGCRIRSTRVIREDARIQIVLPRALTGGRPLKLLGRVARRARENSSAGVANAFAATVTFDLPDQASRLVLAGILTRIAIAPPSSGDPSEAGVAAAPGIAQRLKSIAFPWARQTTVHGDPPTLEAIPKVAETEGSTLEHDQRRHPRGQFEQEVIAIGDHSSRPVVGRDLSIGGMRVEPSPDLAVGDSLKIAVYASASDEPFFLRARVVQDYGADGLGLEFDKSKPVPAERLAALVASLPAIESLRDPKANAKPNVVCEIVPEDD